MRRGRGFVEGVSKEMVVRRDEWVSAEMKGGKCGGGWGVRFSLQSLPTLAMLPERRAQTLVVLGPNPI